MLMNRRNAWADEDVESDDQLNNPQFSSDWGSDADSSSFVDTKSSVSSVSSNSTPTARKLGKNAKIKNLPLSRESLQQMHKQTDLSGDDTSATRPSSGRSSVERMDMNASPSGAQKPVLPEFRDELREPDGSVNLPSIGSALHEQGKCQPCLFVSSQVGCQKAEDCSFCHFAHKRHSRTRPCKAKRERYRRLIARELEEMSGRNTPSNASDAGGEEDVSTVSAI